MLRLPSLAQLASSDTRTGALVELLYEEHVCVDPCKIRDLSDSHERTDRETVLPDPFAVI